MQIKCLISLGQTQSITQTANQLFVSQSTVSKNIKRLEDELGFKIIYVKSHQTSFTEEGHYLWTHVQKLDTQFNLVLEHIYSDKSSKPIIVCHSIVPFEKAYLPLFMQLFETHHKREIQLSGFHPSSYEDSINLLLQQKATFILIQEDFFHNDPRISFTPLLKGRYSVIVPRHHPLAQKKILHLADLKAQKVWVWNSVPPVNSVAKLTQTLRDTISDIKITEVPSVAGCEMYAASGEGFGIVPSFAYDHSNPDVVYNFLDVPIPINYGVSYLRTTKKEAYFPAVIHDLTTAVKTKKDLWS